MMKREKNLTSNCGDGGGYDYYFYWKKKNLNLTLGDGLVGTMSCWLWLLAFVQNCEMKYD